MRPTLHLRVSPGVLRAELRRRAVVGWAAEAPFGDADELAAAIAALAVEAPALRRASRVDVTIDAPLVQLRTLHDLPPVRSRGLAALVSHQANRFFRRNGKPLVTDAVWITRSRWWRRGVQPLPVARAAAIEAPWADAIADGTRAAGLPLPTIAPSAEVGRQKLDLVSPANRTARRRRARGRTGRLAAIALVLWVGTAGLYVGRLLIARHRLDAETARLRKASEAVVRVRRTLHETEAMVAAVDRDAEARGVILTQLGAVLASVPDSAYLASIELDRTGSGALAGGARRTAEVVAALERSSVVAGARLQGSPILELSAGHHWERFSVRFGRETAR